MRVYVFVCVCVCVSTCVCSMIDVNRPCLLENLFGQKDGNTSNSNPKI